MRLVWRQVVEIMGYIGRVVKVMGRVVVWVDFNRWDFGGSGQWGSGGLIWVVERERERERERSCRGLERRERESRDILFLVGCLYYFKMLYEKIKYEMLNVL